MSPPPPPVSLNDLIFPSAHATANATFAALNRSSLSVTNRLHSIKHDADFVRRVQNAYHLPLVANERCGSWYIDPVLKAGGAYYKSTDGHWGEWGLSLRRLNLNVLEIIGEHGGCIIVDSTRRGKSMPDALCKTVPIWIAVLNRVVFPDRYASHRLSTPEDVISRSEHAQIEERLPQFVAELKGLGLDIDALRSMLRGQPMRAVWVTPDTELLVRSKIVSEWNVIVLCTASGRTLASKPDSFQYVQGAADDQESWAQGLTPLIFWRNMKALLSTREEHLPGMIASLLVVSSKMRVAVRHPTLIRPTTNVWVGNDATVECHGNEFDLVVSCSADPNNQWSEVLKDRYIHMPCGEGKNGSRQLRTALSQLSNPIERATATSRILVTCPTGRDLAIGTALALISLYCTDDGTFHPSGSDHALSKTVIKRRLSWLMVAIPDASPSRATLQSVNAYLLS